MLVVSSASFNLSTKISSCVLCFFLVVMNLSFLPAIVVQKLVSFNFEKGKTSLEHTMQLQESFSFSKTFSFSKSQTSQQMALWFLATGFLHILHGNFTGIVTWYFYLFIYFYLFVHLFGVFVCFFFLVHRYILLLFCFKTVSKFD